MTASTTTPTIGPSLVPVGKTGWRAGLANLVRKEMGQWWTTRMWWIQVLVWLVLLNGVTTVVMLDSSMGGIALLEEAVQTFLLVGATAIGIGVVLTIQGAMAGERDMGTAAWVMSKPVSRTAFVASKLIANSVGFLVTAVAIPSIVFVVEAQFLLPVELDYTRFATAVAVVALSVVFYVVLTIALGSIFRGRGPAAGIGIGLILVGQFFKGMLPLSFVSLTPWLLGDVATSYAIGSIPDWNRPTPILATSVTGLALIVAANWRFQGEEF